MSVTVYEDDHEKEISQSDSVKKMIINEASDTREHRYQLEGTKRGIQNGESKYRVTRTDVDEV